MHDEFAFKKDRFREIGYITLFGDGGALFTKQNFRASYYYLFSMLAKVKEKVIGREAASFLLKLEKTLFWRYQLSATMK